MQRVRPYPFDRTGSEVLLHVQETRAMRFVADEMQARAGTVAIRRESPDEERSPHRNGPAGCEPGCLDRVGVFVDARIPRQIDGDRVWEIVGKGSPSLNVVLGIGHRADLSTHA